MKHAVTISAVILLAASPIPAGAAGSSEFDRAMQPILAEYLKIQTSLAADETAGIADAVASIGDLAKALDPETAHGEHAQHYQNIPADLVAACRRMEEATEIDALREGFKDLSKPVSMWVTMAEPEGVGVMYCPMEEAGWVQRGSEVLNPYFGSKMLRCGEKVGGAD